LDLGFNSKNETIDVNIAETAFSITPAKNKGLILALNSIPFHLIAHKLVITKEATNNNEIILRVIYQFVA
jgi:hypothetical protein